MTKKWTDEEIAVLRRYYPFGSAAVAKHLPMRTIAAIKTKAERLFLQVSKEGWKRAHAYGLKKASKAKSEAKGLPKPRQPFDDVPPEYIKVGSIFRVGHRYGVQA